MQTEIIKGKRDPRNAYEYTTLTKCFNIVKIILINKSAL